MLFLSKHQIITDVKVNVMMKDNSLVFPIKQVYNIKNGQNDINGGYQTCVPVQTDFFIRDTAV